MLLSEHHGDQFRKSCLYIPKPSELTQFSWLYPPEILPLTIRAKGASLSTASNWAFNWLVGELTPILQEWIQWRLYLVHAFFCAVSFVVGMLTPIPSFIQPTNMI